MKNASHNLFNLNGKFLININHKNFACTNKSHLCFNFILCICHVFTKSDCVDTNTDKSNPVCKPLNTNVTLTYRQCTQKSRTVAYVKPSIFHASIMSQARCSQQYNEQTPCSVCQRVSSKLIFKVGIQKDYKVLVQIAS